MINGINHITFAVSNLDSSLNFYNKILGLPLIAKWSEGAYLLAGSTWIALNICQDEGISPRKDYTHISFNIEPNQLSSFINKLLAAGVRPFKENSSEGVSFYFLDPDGHKLELHSNSLDDRLSWMKEQNLDGFKLYK